MVEYIKLDTSVLIKQNNSKEKKIKTRYANDFIINKVFGGPIKYIYQFIFDENGCNNTNIIQYFILHVLVLCIKLNSL